MRFADPAAEPDDAPRLAWEAEWDRDPDDPGDAGLRRNVAIALGNWLAGMDEPNPDAEGELVAALSDEDPAVAEAAGWALREFRRGG